MTIKTWTPTKNEKIDLIVGNPTTNMESTSSQYVDSAAKNEDKRSFLKIKCNHLSSPFITVSLCFTFYV